jgi:hypothetical protein
VLEELAADRRSWAEVVHHLGRPWPAPDDALSRVVRQLKTWTHSPAPAPNPDEDPTQTIAPMALAPSVQRRGQWRVIRPWCLVVAAVLLAGLLVFIGRSPFTDHTTDPAEQLDLPRTPVQIRHLDGHTGPVRTVLFLPDGRRVLSGSGWPAGDGTLRLWDSESGQELRRMQMPRLPLAVGAAGAREASGEIHSLALSPDGRRALAGSAGGLVILWDLETGKVLRRFEGHSQTVMTLAFHPNGRWALSGGRDCALRLWDVDAGKELRRFEGHTGWVRGLAFSPDGRHVLSGGRDRTVRLWEVDTGRELSCVSSERGNVETVAFSPDGRRAVWGEGTSLRLWDMDEERELRRCDAHPFGVNHALFSPDGRLILSGGYDSMVRLWDAETGQLVHVFSGHRNWVWSVAFAPDGRRILSAGGGASQGGTFGPGKDFLIRVWTVPDSSTDR